MPTKASNPFPGYISVLGRLRSGKGRLETKATPFTRFALHLDVSAHHPDDLAADVKPQADPFGFAERAAGLFERFEDARELFGGDSDAGVLDLENDGRGLPRRIRFAAIDPEGHGTLLGEFDGVSQKIDQHLAEPEPVRLDPFRKGAGRAVDETDALVLRALPENPRHVFQKFRQVRGFARQLHLAGFDSRQIQDFVDEAQQVLSAFVDDPHAFAEGPVDVAAVLVQLGVSKYGVQGRAQFVAHAQQKPAFGPVRGFGGLLGRFQVGLGFHLARDVRGNADHVAGSARRRGQGPRSDLHLICSRSMA